MDNLYLTDEEIWGKEPTWEEQEIERLKKENQALKWTIDDAKTAANRLYSVAKRAIETEVAPSIKRYLKSEIEDIKDLLEVLED